MRSCANFFDCKYFFELNALGILALYEMNSDNPVDSGNFFVRGYFPLMQKDSTTHMNGLAVYVKQGLLFAWDLSLERYVDIFYSEDHFLCLYARFFILFYLT